MLLVQHIEASFVAGFVAWLRDAGRASVKVAEHGASLERGTVYVPPSDHHLGVALDGRIALSDAAPISGFRPSGTHLLKTLACGFGKRALGIILTGMGSDGAEGAQALHEAGGYVIAQVEASCTVAGHVQCGKPKRGGRPHVGARSIAGHIR